MIWLANWREVSQYLHKQPSIDSLHAQRPPQMPEGSFCPFSLHFAMARLSQWIAIAQLSDEKEQRTRPSSMKR